MGLIHIGTGSYLYKECTPKKSCKGFGVIIQTILPEEKRVVLGSHLVGRIVAQDPTSHTITVYEMGAHLLV